MPHKTHHLGWYAQFIFDCMISQVNERNFPYRKKEQGALEEHHSMQKPNLISNHLELLSDNNYNENMVATRINYLKYNILL